ncbi:GspH/FimT family pseudopilin [Paraburkholderia sp. SOS3]|jgi:type IV fimbrial biogenesis protein FimT|uniref:GspH/FimT family pseudopilin n=1 Tax=Paraburkholderia sp. SOS3 TaxID=1926494 RepID=UPI0009474CB1|nr:GspH/FimT family pseudopilin [Paraburkholderia sp. SOS3]APR36822.1 type II secretion system protein GspH [Paraburkholderia sp. SOS3]
MRNDGWTRCVRCGFTLLETLAVVALLALLAAMATPSFVAWQMRDQVEARAHALLSTLAYARSEAIRRGVRITVCRIDAARHCLAAGQACRSGAVDWSCGWAVMIERAGAMFALRAQPEFAAVSIAGASTNLTFTPPAGQTIGSFRSFDLAPRVSSKATQGNAWRRCIRIAAGGRARIAEGACGASA